MADKSGKKFPKTNVLYEMPLGLGMALSGNPVALTRFANLTLKQQNDIIRASHAISSGKEMREFAQSIADNKFF